jgi:hypothetical protein
MALRPRCLAEITRPGSAPLAAAALNNTDQRRLSNRQPHPERVSRPLA